MSLAWDNTPAAAGHKLTAVSSPSSISAGSSLGLLSALEVWGMSQALGSGLRLVLSKQAVAVTQRNWQHA